MATYKRIVCCCVVLAAVLAISEICSYIIDISSPYYEDVLNASIPFNHDFVWIAVYMLMTVLAAECFINPKLKEFSYHWIFLFIIHIFWIVCLFVIDSLETALSAIFLINILTLNILFIYVKHTKYLSFIMLPVAAWYCYLFFANFFILVSA